MYLLKVNVSFQELSMHLFLEMFTLKTNMTVYSVKDYKYLSVLFFSTYNKQWTEAQSALMDLLVQEMPAEPPKPERVSCYNKCIS
jgi:hypothetical protein